MLAAAIRGYLAALGDLGERSSAEDCEETVWCGVVAAMLSMLVLEGGGALCASESGGELRQFHCGGQVVSSSSPQQAPREQQQGESVVVQQYSKQLGTGWNSGTTSRDTRSRTLGQIYLRLPQRPRSCVSRCWGQSRDVVHVRRGTLRCEEGIAWVPANIS